VNALFSRIIMLLESRLRIRLTRSHDNDNPAARQAPL
jgi:hypothetical protein